MINIPATDILTPITGEVEKTVSTVQSNTVEASFLSVVTAEDTDAQTLVPMTNPSLTPQTQPKSQTDHMAFAAAFPALITAPETSTDSGPAEIMGVAGDVVLASQSHSSATPLQPISLPVPIIEPQAATQGSANIAQPVLPIDSRQMAPSSPIPPKDPRHAEPQIASKSVIDAPVQTTMEKGQVAAPVNGSAVLPANRGTAATMDAPTVVPRPAATVSLLSKKTAPFQSDFAAPPMAKSTEKGGATRHYTSIVPSTVAQTNTYDADVMPPKPTASLGGLLPRVDATLAPGVLLTQPTPDQQTVKGNLDARSIASNPVTGPLQGPVPRATMTSTADQPMTPVAWSSPVKTPLSALTADVTPPAVGQPPTALAKATQITATTPSGPPLNVAQDGMAPSTTAPLQAATATAKTPTIMPQRQAKQSPTSPAESALPLEQNRASGGFIPQAPVPIAVDRFVAKWDSHPTAAQQAPVSTGNDTKQTVPPIAMAPITLTPEAISSEALEPLAMPEFLPIELKGSDSLQVLRHDATLNRPEVMRHVAQQLVDVARQMPDRPVELALNPEELGRVRLTFTTTDGGIHVAVMAERGETMDLLRRHIETLAQEFRELGYKDVNFAFSQNGQNEAQNDGSDNQDNTESESAPAQPNPLAPVQLSLEPSAGLDLRL